MDGPNSAYTRWSLWRWRCSRLPYRIPSRATWWTAVSTCRPLRSSDASLLSSPRTPSTELARRAFSVAAPRTCISLDLDALYIYTFKRQFKTHLFTLQS